MTFNAIIFIYHRKAKKTGLFRQLVMIFLFNFQNLCLEALLLRHLSYLRIVDGYRRSQITAT